MCQRSAPASTGLALALALPLFAGCGHGATEGHPAPGPTPAPLAVVTAAAEIAALGTSGVHGRLTLTRVDAGVKIEGRIEGLPPTSAHGFHVHEKGDCSAADGASAGGHFNPMATMHGPMDAADSHAGDLGNLTADRLGVAQVALTKLGVSLADGGPADLVGRGVIVHALVDDLKTQPTGASGARIACGVVKASTPDAPAPAIATPSP
ncbi:MAG: superoxide dismutase family protein [Deltaproteobacteria bacterium]|nr:superoxide dismutase family protein [Deltaproteobacteria bacterium]